VSIASINTYLRRSSGLRMVDPDPGPADRLRPPAAGVAHAAGLELGIRRLAGRWTGAASYTLAGSRLAVEERSFASPQDQRHTAKGNLSVAVSSGARISLAGLWATGGAATRLVVPDSTGSCDAALCWERAVTDQPGGMRLGSRWGLAGSVSQRFSLLGVSGSAYLRIADGRAPSYLFSSLTCGSENGCEEEGGDVRDHFQALPGWRGSTLGIRVAF
jgi:hypothetical protein